MLKTICLLCFSYPRLRNQTFELGQRDITFNSTGFSPSVQGHHETPQGMAMQVSGASLLVMISVTGLLEAFSAAPALFFSGSGAKGISGTGACILDICPGGVYIE